MDADDATVRESAGEGNFGFDQFVSVEDTRFLRDR
jgi:hypothetical protein